MHLTRRNSLSRRASHEDMHNEGSEDEDFGAGENDGIQLGLLSGRPRAGKERLVDGSNGEENSTKQLAISILGETVPTLMSTVVGMVFTGQLLETISTWRALRQLNELFIIIPMLNNMKGNLEMNLSARLSTAANTGELDDAASRRTQLWGNMSLLQVQGLVLSALAAIGSFSLGKLLPPASEDALATPQATPFRWLRDLSLQGNPIARGTSRPSKLPPGNAKSGFPEFLTMIAIAMSSASLSSLILGSFMCSLILICRRFRLNPDNISTPIASCLGDLLTLTLLSFIATLLTLPQLYFRLPLISALFFFIVLGLAILASLRNAVSRPLLKDGLSWIPLLCAMCISSGTGVVLDKFVTKWKDFGSLAIVVSGLPGGIGAVFVSRLSTDLHSRGDNSNSGEESERPLATGTILFAVGLPVLITYLTFMCVVGWIDLPILFLVIFVLAFCISSVISLLLANWLTRQLWARGYDPDSYCLPVHSSVMDLIGQGLLVLAYTLASLMGVSVRIIETAE